MPPPGSPKSRFAGCLQSCLVVLILFVLAGGYFWWKGRQIDKADAERGATIKQFDRFIGAKGPPADAVDDAQARYRKGRLLPIDARDGKLDALYFRGLPAALLATRADEVGTLVWLNLNRKDVGKYDNGGTAWKDSYDVVVYDVARRAVVAREHIEGEDPPQKTEVAHGTGFGWEKAPVDQLIKFLQDLPAR